MSDPKHLSNISQPSFSRVRRVPILVFLIVVSQIALLAAFVSYVWAHRVMQSRLTMWATAPNNNILLVSTILSRVPPYIVPFAMGLAAYGFARDWLIASAIPDQTVHPGTPTPEEYHIALRVIGVADLGSLYSALKFLFWKPSFRSSMEPHPRWLLKSIFLLGTLTSLSYLIGFIDLWLHQSIVSVRLTTFSTSPTPTTSFSRRVNATYCSHSFFFSPCPSIDEGNAYTSIVGESEAFATATNTSSLNEVILIPDTPIALLLPAAQIRSGKSYQANTFGTYSTCAPVSVECSLFAADGASAPFACLDRPAFVGDARNAGGSTTLSHFNESGTRQIGASSTTDVGAWGQPLEFGVVSVIQSVGSLADPQIVSLVDGGYAILLWCEMNILNVTYLYQPYHDNQVQLMSYELASLNDTYTISGPIYTGFGLNMISNAALYGIASGDSRNYSSAFAQQLSRVALSFSAGIVEPAKTLVDHPAASYAHASQIFLPAVVVFILALSLFALNVLAIGLETRADGPTLKDFRSRDVLAVKLARERLSSPGTVVYELFCAQGTKELGHAGCLDSSEMFRGHGGAGNRIRVGIPDQPSEEGHFGISTSVTRPLNVVGGTKVL